MTDILDTVKAALDAATPGGWYWDSRNSKHYLCTANPDKYLVVLGWPCGMEEGSFFTDDERGHADANLVQMAPTWLRALVVRVEQAEAENARLREQTCATCRHQVTQFRPDDPTCGLTRRTDGVHVVVTSVPCRFLGHGCRAWAALEGDHE